MANSVTRCPKCDTSFRITEAHLNSAKGAVRCGSCLHIFNAREHLEIEEKPPQPEEDDILISDDMESEEDDSYSSDMDSNVILASTFGPADANLFERDNIDEDDDEPVDTDESWAESLLDDDDDTPLVREPTEEAAQAPGKSLFESKDTATGTDGNFYGTQPPPPPGSRISSDHFKIIDSLRNEEEHQTEYDDTDAYQPEDHGDYSDDQDSDDFVQTTYEENDYQDEIEDIDEIDDYAYSDQFGTTSNSHYINAIEPEPVEFNVKTGYPIWHSKGLWASLAVVAALLLIVQLAIFRFDDLSTVEPWRSYYAKACSFFSCELPPLSDRSKIKASNLVVRSHPEIDNALMVDAILRNTARFPQTFPSLDLVFVDIKNNPVAARRFEAKEYLGGELAGKNNMPVNQPVHIAIEISDPGPQAVSYFITIPN